MIADLNTHLTWLRRFALQQTVTRLPFGDAISVEIAVEGGLMAGTSTCLTTESLVIGSGPDCDVQLFDEDVAEQHLRLQLRTSLFGTLAEITPMQAAEIEDEEPLVPGEGSRLLRLPLVLSVGQAKLRISAPESTGLARSFNKRTFAMMGLVVVLAVGLFLSVNQIVRAAQIQSIALTVAQPPVDKVSVRPDGPEVAQAKLDEFGLAQDLVVQTGEQGSLFIAGTVPSARWTNWTAFRSWYDQQAGMPTLVSSVTMAPKLVELRPIASVQLHEPATVFFAVGQPAKIGDVIDEGWTLTEIDAEGLTLTRSNETTRIRF